MKINNLMTFGFFVLVSTALGTSYCCDAARAPHTTVYSDVSKTYLRVKLPDGSYQPESYAIGKGVMINNGSEDESLTVLSIEDMGTLLKPALMEADYIPTQSPEETDLLILVNWGKTIPYYDESMHEWEMEEIANFISHELSIMDYGGAGYDGGMSIGSMGESLHSFGCGSGFSPRRMLLNNNYNARLLGYTENISRVAKRPINFQSELSDFAYELNQPRYFVILQAYDFQEMWRNKTKKLLWVSRLSIRAKKHRFDEQFQNMALAATRFYGQKDGAFRRHQTPSRVIMKELEYLGTEK